MNQHSDQDAPRRDDSVRDDEDDSLDRAAILARRKMLVTSALAGLAMQHCDSLPNPFRPCLEPAIHGTLDTSPEITPVPCLTPPLIETDAQGAVDDASEPPHDAETQPDANGTPDASRQRVQRRREDHRIFRTCLSIIRRRDPEPAACLNVARPQACLDFKRVDDDDA